MAASILAGAVLGGGLAALTPAGAAVGSFAADVNWKQAWQDHIRPRTDNRYYTKTKSDKRYYTKSKSDKNLANGLAGYYTKADSDAKYAPLPGVIRGISMQAVTAAAGGNVAGADISFGFTLSAPPTLPLHPHRGTSPAWVHGHGCVARRPAWSPVCVRGCGQQRRRKPPGRSQWWPGRDRDRRSSVRYLRRRRSDGDHDVLGRAPHRPGSSVRQDQGHPPAQQRAVRSFGDVTTRGRQRRLPSPGPVWILAIQRDPVKVLCRLEIGGLDGGA